MRSSSLVRAAAQLAAGLVALPSPSADAQAERSRHADTWTFGTSCRLDWNVDGTSFVMSTNTNISTGEGCASLSDPETGQLLIYTDGGTVWNGANQQVGTTLPGEYSSSMHAGVIVPVPGATVVHTVEQAGTPGQALAAPGQREAHIAVRHEVGHEGTLHHAEAPGRLQPLEPDRGLELAGSKGELVSDHGVDVSVNHLCVSFPEIRHDAKGYLFTERAFERRPHAPEQPLVGVTGCGIAAEPAPVKVHHAVQLEFPGSIRRDQRKPVAAGVGFRALTGRCHRSCQ